MRGVAGLSWLGQHGGAVIAVGVFLGLLLPPLASLLRPLLVPAILGPFLIALLEHPRFISGDVDTGFVDAERATLVALADGDPPAEAISVARAATGMAATGTSGSTNVPDPWTTLRGWRG